MKIKLYIILIVLLIILTGCSEEIYFDRNNAYGVTYRIKEDVIVDGNPKYMEAYIFEDFDSYKSYYREYFEVDTNIVIPDGIDFKKESLLLCNTLLNEGNEGVVYSIKEIKKNGNKIKVYMKTDGYVKVKDDNSGLHYNHTYLIKIDKNLIPEDFEIIVVKKQSKDTGVIIEQSVN